MWWTAIRPSFLAMAFLAAATPQARADILLYSDKTAPQAWLTTLWQAVKLNGNGDLSLLFTNPQNGLVSVTFTAECQVITSPGFSLPTLTINIIIDEDVVPVTNGDDAFCSGGKAGVGGRLSTRAFTVAANLAAGQQVLRVDAAASISNGARLDDITVLIAR